MNIQYKWKIEVKNTPALKRKCNHCSGNRFYCSDKFRINAQKKKLDVWLIYRCVACDSTYNVTIVSRTNPELIRKDLFLKFSENDKDTAWKYAFSAETARKNKVELDYESVDYEIVHAPVSLSDILKAEDETIAFRIQTPFEFGLKLSAVVRSCLGVSAGFFRRMAEAGAIFTPEGYPQNKHKVKDGDTVVINKEKLQGLYPDKPRS